MPEQPNPDHRPVRRRAGIALAVTLLAGVALGACGSDGDDEPAADTSSTTAPTEEGAVVGDAASASDLDGLDLTSTEVTGRDLVEGTTIRLTFADGRLSAQAGCNTLVGGYVHGDGMLAWDGEPAGSMMACEDDLSAQDAWLTELLTGGVEAEVSDDGLVLTDGEVTITLAPPAEG